MRFQVLLVLLLSGARCSPQSTDASNPDAISDDQGDASYIDASGETSCLDGANRHRLYMQGRQVNPNQEGRYPLLENRNAIVHGEHVLFNEGALVEWAVPLCADVGGHVSFFIPNNEPNEAVADAHWELLVVRDESTVVVADARDNVQHGQSGYVPFEAEVQDVPRQGGDQLIVRVTNESPNWYVVVIFNPPSEYMAWIELDVW